MEGALSYPQKSYHIWFSTDSFSRFGRSIGAAAVALTLAGCVQSAPTPSPAVVALQGACSGGDMQACASIADLEARERARQTAANQAAIADMSASNQVRQYSDPLGAMAAGMAASERQQPALAPITVTPMTAGNPVTPVRHESYMRTAPVTRCVPQYGSYTCSSM